MPLRDKVHPAAGINDGTNSGQILAATAVSGRREGPGAVTLPQRGASAPAASSRFPGCHAIRGQAAEVSACVIKLDHDPNRAWPETDAVACGMATERRI